MLRFETLKPQDHARVLPILAQLCLDTFRDYPFHYDGDLDFELNDLSAYARLPDARVFLALDGGDLAGFSTCIPIAGEDDLVKKPLLDAGVDLNEFLYLGESLLKPNYRGQGIGKSFFDLREAHALTLPKVKNTVFFTLSQPKNDPRRPTSYYDLRNYWAKRGYQKVESWITHYPWDEVGTDEPVSHPMEYWLKPIQNRLANI